MAQVTAIVSTYNSERFLRGCLDDLLAQTLVPEVIVVNAGSKQAEAHILREYLERGVALKVITSLREPLYQSLNRGLHLASGEYLTIANTDDRHRPDALEIMKRELDSHPEIDLVYGDCIVTDTPNAVWNGDYHICKEPPYVEGKLSWPDFDPELLLAYCYIGPQPMWRRSLHEQVGEFDSSFLIAGDYEFALRLTAHGIQFRRVHETLGLYQSGGMSMTSNAQAAIESRRAVLRWRNRILSLTQHSATELSQTKHS